MRVTRGSAYALASTSNAVAMQYMWENMSSSSESSCPSEIEVDDTAAPASIATPDHLKSPLPLLTDLGLDTDVRSS